MTLQPLPAYPQPYADELISSWIERIGLFYGIDYLSTIALLGALEEDVDIDEHSRGLLGNWTQHPVGDIPRRLNPSDDDLMGLAARLTYCAACWDQDVAEGRQPYIRSQWSRWTVVECPHHQTWLHARPPRLRSETRHGWVNVWRSRSKWANALDQSVDRTYDAWGFVPESVAQPTVPWIEFEADLRRALSQDSDDRTSLFYGSSLISGVVSHELGPVRRDVHEAMQVGTLRKQFNDSDLCHIRRDRRRPEPAWIAGRVVCMVIAVELIRLMEGRPPCFPQVRPIVGSESCLQRARSFLANGAPQAEPGSVQNTRSVDHGRSLTLADFVGRNLHLRQSIHGSHLIEANLTADSHDSGNPESLPASAGAVGELLDVPSGILSVMPPRRKLGQARETIANTISVALLPLAAMNFGYQKARDYFETCLSEDLQRKLEHAVPEQIIDPKPAIVGPILRELAFAHREGALREMYLGLLASAMNQGGTEAPHPAFAETIRQLAPEEGVVLSWLWKYVSPIAVVDIRYRDPEGNGHRTLRPFVLNLTDPTTGDVVSLPRMPSMISNFIRLGLLRASTSEVTSRQSAYDFVETRPELIQARVLSDPPSAVFAHRYSLLWTPFAYAFLRAVDIEDVEIALKDHG